MVNFQLIGATLFPFIGGGLGSMITKKEIPTWYKVNLRMPQSSWKYIVFQELRMCFSDIPPTYANCYGRIHISEFEKAMVLSSKLGIWSGMDNIVC